MIRLSAAFLALSQSALAVAAQYPKLDWDKTVPVLVIASIEKVEEMEPLPQCASASSLCRDPPPVLLELKVQSTIFGPESPATVHAATTTHEGIRQFRYVPGRQWLMLLLTVESDFVMVRNAYDAVEEGINGELLLIPEGDNVPFWLPCSSTSMYRTLGPSERWDWPMEASRAEDMEFLRSLDQAGPETIDPPQYGLPIARLTKHLNELQPSQSDFSCRPSPKLNELQIGG